MCSCQFKSFLLLLMGRGRKRNVERVPLVDSSSHIWTIGATPATSRTISKSVPALRPFFVLGANNPTRLVVKILPTYSERAYR